MGNEIWTAISGYEGLYDVSNMGRVRSLKRNTTSGKILVGVPDKDGYLHVTLSKDGVPRRRSVHRLVAMAFVDGHSDKCNIVNHINEVVNDNRAENLEWCDAAYNTNYGGAQERRARARYHPVIASKNGVSIPFQSVKEASEILMISHGNISMCASGTRKTAGGFKFRYGELGLG